MFTTTFATLRNCCLICQNSIRSISSTKGYISVGIRTSRFGATVLTSKAESKKPSNRHRKIPAVTPEILTSHWNSSKMSISMSGILMSVCLLDRRHSTGILGYLTRTGQLRYAAPLTIGQSSIGLIATNALSTLSSFHPPIHPKLWKKLTGSQTGRTLLLLWCRWERVVPLATASIILYGRRVKSMDSQLCHISAVAAGQPETRQPRSGIPPTTWNPG